MLRYLQEAARPRCAASCCHQMSAPYKPATAYWIPTTPKHPGCACSLCFGFVQQAAERRALRRRCTDVKTAEPGERTGPSNWERTTRAHSTTRAAVVSPYLPQPGSGWRVKGVETLALETNRVVVGRLRRDEVRQRGAVVVLCCGPNQYGGLKRLRHTTQDACGDARERQVHTPRSFQP
jgi:hypothetical protein